MLKQNIIQESTSQWSSPIWIVPKKLDSTGKQKWRLVVDYRKLKEKTIDDTYPLPNINDIFDKFGKSQYFTTLDLANGVHQIEMDPSAHCEYKRLENGHCEYKRLENGHWEYKRLAFGLKNARVMDNVL